MKKSYHSKKIAVIGMSCRFPGANSVEEFWEILKNGICAVSEVPAERWDIEKYYDPDIGKTGKMNIRHGGFISHIDQFDPGFFNITEHEAAIMDPQQRLLLEVAWEALEHAGKANHHLAGSNTGVFIGISNIDYARFYDQGSYHLDAYTGTGNAHSIAANRLSYSFDLRGPSISLDTACSSSLVSLHMAARNLREGVCDMALAGGVNLIITPDVTVACAQAGMMSSAGKCRTFDDEADGYVRSEGVGVLVLKRLEDALRDHDPVLAVIRGSAINQDGLSNGLTAPNSIAQQQVLKAALADAQLQPSQLSYVEAHGTGTPLGDPIEINSLKKVLLPGRHQDEPCAIGSVKTNIGHTESAAGMAGVIKVILSLFHQDIPAHLHLNKLNRHIDLTDLPLWIPATHQPWTVRSGPRYAGVSSFGFGGTNAHVILEEAPQGQRGENPHPREHKLLTLSAKNPGALKDLADRYIQYIDNNPGLSIEALCYTANCGRKHFPYRIASTGATLEQLSDHLKQTVSGINAHNKQSAFKPVFLFTGQGAQYPGMGKELFQSEPVFKEAINLCDEILQPLIHQSIKEIIFDDTDQERLHQTAYTQPALFSLEYALSQLWHSWGITPKVVMGHSVGEFTAACVAGVFSLEEGLYLISQRGALMQSLPPHGRMTSVFADAATVENAIRDYEETISVAAYNGPCQTVISGEAQAMEAILSIFDQQHIPYKPLVVSHAFHSPLMQPMVDAFTKVCAQVRFAQPKIGLMSNLTGNFVTKEVTEASYWVKHILSPVNFMESIRQLEHDGYKLFVEIGPKPILSAMARDCTTHADIKMLASMRTDTCDSQQMVNSLAQLYMLHAKIDWDHFYSGVACKKIILPTYPFQRKKYWIDQVAVKHITANGSKHAEKIATVQQSPIINWLQAGDAKGLSDYLFPKPASSRIKPYADRVVDSLVRKFQQDQRQSLLDEQMYTVHWKDFSGTPYQEERISGSWIIFKDKGLLGDTIASEIIARGGSVITVMPGNFNRINSDHYTVDPASPGDFTQLMEALKKDRHPLKGIIHLWTLHLTYAEATTAETLMQQHDHSCGSLLHLVQALVREGMDQLRLAIATRGGQSVSNREPADPWHTAVAGFARVLNLEHPEWRTTCIDLDPEEHKEEAGLLLHTILGRYGEERQIAHRQGKTKVARLLSNTRNPVKTGPVHIVHDKTYLITGGCGALGLLTAGWLIERGARYLVLSGRRGASEKALQEIQRMEKSGVHIRVVSCDIGDYSSVKRMLDSIHQELPPLTGIIHAAGVLDDAVIMNQSLAKFHKVISPKVSGVWNLHQLTQQYPLDMFVTFSSIASMIGSPGQANYAVGNAFMDGLMWRRQAMQLPAMSINWGAWAGEGMLSRSKAGSRIELQGIDEIKPAEGLMYLEYLLDNGWVQTGVMPVRWEAMDRQYTRSPFLSALVQPDAFHEDEDSQKPDLYVKMQTARPQQRRALLLQYLQREIAMMLDIAEKEVLDTSIGFNDLGLDSLMVVELKNKIQMQSGILLSATVLFNYANLDSLTDYLLGEMVFDASAEEVKTAEAIDHTDDLLASILTLSEEETRDTLLNKINTLLS